MKRRSSLLSIVLAALFFAGCRSAPIRLNEVQEGQWRAKALIKDHEQSRSYIVNLNLNVRRDQMLRMDVTTTLGMGVASLLVTGNDVHYVLLDTKRFYYGSSQPGVMRPILAVPFDPRWLQNILFDIPFAKPWSCAKDAGGWLSSCENPTLGLKITWSSRHGEKKTILLEHSKASVQINVQSFKPKVEERKNLFTLEAPNGFQKLHVRQ